MSGQGQGFSQGMSMNNMTAMGQPYMQNVQPQQQFQPHSVPYTSQPGKNPIIYASM